MSDLEHRAWTEERRRRFVGVQIPYPFLDAYVGQDGHGTGPRAPEDIDRQLHTIWAGAPDLPGTHAVVVPFLIDELPALAALAEECMTGWVGRSDLGHGRGVHVAAAATLAAHVRHTIAREYE